MKIFRKPLTYLKRHKSRSLAINPPGIDLNAVTKSSHSSQGGASFRTLPAELQYMIYVYALSNLEIRIVQEHINPPSPKSKPAVWNEDHSKSTYIVSPTSLSHLDFYQDTLFPLAADWHYTPWESHVLFVFPSALSLIEVLMSPFWPRDRLSLIRKLRLYERQFYHSDGPASKRYDTLDVLPILVQRGMTLDLFEYAPLMPLQQYATGHLTNELGQLLVSPGWSTLHILSTKSEIYWADVIALRTIFLQSRARSSYGAFLRDLPCTPALTRDEYGEVVGSFGAYVNVREDDFWNRISVPDRIGWEEWLDGGRLCVQIVASRDMSVTKRLQGRVRLSRRWQVELVALARDHREWIEKRKAGKVSDCFHGN